MKKIAVKKLIDFRRLGSRGKKNFAQQLASTKVNPPSDGGGNYWIPSESAIIKSFLNLTLLFVDKKISSLADKSNKAKLRITKNMYLRNIDILNKYKKLSEVIPLLNDKPTFIKKNSTNSILNVKGFLIQVLPSCVYSFEDKNQDSVGAIWFVVKKDGYNNEELGMFCEMQYKYLQRSYGSRFTISSKYCIVVDVFNSYWIDYSQIEENKVRRVLSSTLEELGGLM